MPPDPHQLAVQVGQTMYAADRASVASGCSIEFLKPARLGNVLTCEGVEQLLQGRHGIYDMTVSNQRGGVVAVFRGKSAHIPGHVIAEPV